MSRREDTRDKAREGGRATLQVREQQRLEVHVKLQVPVPDLDTMVGGDGVCPSPLGPSVIAIAAAVTIHELVRTLKLDQVVQW